MGVECGDDIGPGLHTFRNVSLRSKQVEEREELTEYNVSSHILVGKTRTVSHPAAAHFCLISCARWLKVACRLSALIKSILCICEKQPWSCQFI